ncbi:MAG: L-Ala-D/L-Glu epimerase [Granulosicoccus sp.]|nr:L-Ala-D/L-Glu epimerase [Granulosicoccus sp.]
MTDPVRVQVVTNSFAIDGKFTISRGSRTQAQVLTVVLEAGGMRGRGECVPYTRYGESLPSVRDQIMSLERDIHDGLTRESLQSALPPGAARNALDCALWDLQAKQSNTPVWQLAGLDRPGPLTTAYTLSLDSPQRMKQAAQKNAFRPILKIKLGGPDDMDRLQAVRQGAPESRLIVDANEAWSAKDYKQLAPLLIDLGVAMVEQPLPAASDAALAEQERPLPVCADESCHDRQSLKSLDAKYDVINIKLDKSGGLTEALALREAARAKGYTIMVGCMVGSSLGMAPALLVAQGAEFVDLDGPLLLAEDRELPLQYSGSVISPADSSLWG